jgi:hypothetical protein
MKGGEISHLVAVIHVKIKKRTGVLSPSFRGWGWRAPGWFERNESFKPLKTQASLNVRERGWSEPEFSR